MDMQKLVDMMGEASRQTRAQYQLTLGGMITRLDTMPSDMPIEYEDGGHPSGPHSYRGYYSDLSFEVEPGAATVAQVSAMLKSALGQTFEGYKGGGYTMGEGAPLWSSPYGDNSGVALMAVKVVGQRAIIETKQID